MKGSAIIQEEISTFLLWYPLYFFKGEEEEFLYMSGIA